MCLSNLSKKAETRVGSVSGALSSCGKKNSRSAPAQQMMHPQHPEESEESENYPSAKGP